MVAFALFFYSCNKETIVDDFKETNDFGVQVKSIVDSTLGFTVKVQDSTLYFPKAGDLLKAVEVLKGMPVEDRRKWEKSVGFVSAQTLIEDLQNSIRRINNEGEFHQLVLANKELVKASPDDIYGIESRIYGFYPYITSTRGFFVSESYWGKAFDGKLYSCHFYDYEGYEAMSKLSINNDVSCSNVKMITLDFHENDNLKSYQEVHAANSTYIKLRMRDYGYNDPTKIADFEMSIVNTYGLNSNRTLSNTVTYTQHYFVVNYVGTCCDPTTYSYYYAPFGGWQYFEPYGNGWRIRVPYPNYFDTHPWSNPNWDSEMYFQEQYNVYWYNYFGRVDLHCTFQAQKRDLWWWTNYSGTVIYFKDVVAGVKVGADVYYHSVAQNLSVGPFGHNYIEQNETGYAGCDQFVCNSILTEYTSTPPAVFNSCVSGQLFARFCPEPIFNFSFNY